MPQAGLRAINAVQQGADTLRVGIVVGKPVVRGALIVAAVPAPILLQTEQLRKTADESVARHDAAGEEVPRDPIRRVGGIEAIRRGDMGKYVQEQPPVRAQPSPYASQQRVPVRHVLKHLYRDDAIEAQHRLKVIHVCGDDI